MRHNGLFIEPAYLQKAKDLYQVKCDFYEWSKLSEHVPSDNLETASSLLKKYNLTMPRLIIPGINHPMTLYRARVISADSTEDLSDPKTFTYPPAYLVGHFQRVNAPGYPVFYGAFDGKTVMEEIKINGQQTIRPDDILFISKWEVSPEHIFNLASLTVPEVCGSDQLFSDLTKKILNDFEGIFDGEDTFFRKTQVFLFNEVSKFSLTGKHVQSGMIAHDILYNTGEVNGMHIDGIIYPSCVNNYRSINCLLHPDFVKKALRLNSVKKIKFREFKNDGAFGHLSYFGDLHGDKISWNTFLTEVKPNQHSVHIGLELDWAFKKRLAAKCIINGEDVNLKMYCEDLAESIDFSNEVVKQENIQMHLEHTTGIYHHDVYYDGSSSFLLDEDGYQNPIRLLRISMPMKRTTKPVSSREVLKGR